MISRTSFFFAVALSLAILTSVNAQDEKLELLLNRSPAPPNAIGYVNIGSLNQLMNDAGMSPNVSENVEDFWFISDLDITTLRPKWEAGYAKRIGLEYYVLPTGRS